MGINVLSYLKQTLKRKDKSRDADWDFGARQSPGPGPDTSIRRGASTRRRRSTSLDVQRRAPAAAPAPAQRTEVQQSQQRQQQAKRVSAAVGTDVRGSPGHTPAGSRDTGTRSGSPEDDVLLAAGETAKEARTAAATKPGEQRRRAYSVAADTSVPRPALRHAASGLPRQPRLAVASPVPSVQSLHSVQAESSDASRRAAFRAGKRSMPQLHNVWETFLEEAAEDVDSFDFPMPPVHVSPRRSNSNGSQPPRHHTPTSSSSSTSTAATITSISTVKTLPHHPPSAVQPQSPSPNRMRPRGHMRASHQTSSSTSSGTTSTAGSTSSMAAFSSTSSMTTALDSDDGLHGCDDPVPRSSAPKNFNRADPSLAPPTLAPPIAQRLRKSPTSPALQTVPRGVSPTSSTSSDSYSNSTASCSHSHSTTPTPSSNCPATPSDPSPISPSKYADRLSPVISRGHRQSPEMELSKQPMPPASMKGPSLTNTYRYSNAAGASRGLSSPIEPREIRDEFDEDVLSELGYYGSRQQQRQSGISTISSSSSASTSLSPSGFPVVPPLRQSSRQHLRSVAAQSAPPGHYFSLPRAKSASNLKHDTNAALERPRLSGIRISPPLLVKDDADKSGAPEYSHRAHPQARTPARPQIPPRSQTLPHNHVQVMVDPNNVGLNDRSSSMAVASSSPSSRPGQGRLRSGSAGSASLLNSQAHLQKDANLPVRPPPAPPLDISRLQPPIAIKKGPTNSSPLTPASAVQWGYAL